MYETEEAIDAHFLHSNHPQFFCKEMIQHLVTSNPSPRYVEAVVNAYINGSYDGIGSGEYGDLAATTAAIYLDREARSTVLDHDRTFGLLREPLIKVISFMRAMEFVSEDDREVELLDLDESIGMMQHLFPSVFSFYEPQHSPDGAVADAGLVAPESMILTAPYITGFLNGMLSLINYGLTNCDNGLGSEVDDPRKNCNRIIEEYDEAWWSQDGNLTFEPTSGNVEEIVNELDVLLTAGRLNGNGHAIMEAAYENALLSGGSRIEALKAVQKLFLFTPEFHATNENKLLDIARINDPTAQPTTAPTQRTNVEDSGDGDYKAIVYVLLAGAADSYNFLVPHSECGSKDMYEHYAEIRDDVALSKDELLQISVPNGTQPCNVFGLHPGFQACQKLYEDGDAAWITNIGPLVEPLTMQEYDDESKSMPGSLFAHAAQQTCVMNVHADNPNAKGVLGRIADSLTNQGISSGAYSISGETKVLENHGIADMYDIIESDGVVKTFDESETSLELRSDINNLTSRVSSSIFAETWSELVNSAMERTELLAGVLDITTLTQDFDAADDSDLGEQFETVAMVIKATSEGTLTNRRDAFYVNIGGWDSHNDAFNTLTNKCPNIDNAIDSFAQEMKALNLWNNVTIVTASDFGRTLTSNGAGTDHGWAGNHMIVGGSVRGGKIHGEYPSDLSDDGDYNVGRGRLLPTTSWEMLWQGIAEWFGVEDGNMDYVLPNRMNFDGLLFTEDDLYESA